MLINSDRCCLLVVDIQEKLVPAIAEAEQLIASSKWLIEIAAIMEVPVLTSEQYPGGLGHTIGELDTLLPTAGKMEKMHFSCAADESCMSRIQAAGREQVVIVGMEAHVCVMQTALQLKAAGKEVFVVADAVSSRSLADKTLALERMRQNGLQIVSKEMVAFEWMEKAGTDRFRKISKEYLR